MHVQTVIIIRYLKTNHNYYVSLAYSLDEALADASEGEFTVEVDCSLSELPSSTLLFSNSIEDSVEEVSAADGDPWWW